MNQEKHLTPIGKLFVEAKNEIDILQIVAKNSTEPNGLGITIRDAKERFKKIEQLLLEEKRLIKLAYDTGKNDGMYNPDRDSWSPNADSNDYFNTNYDTPNE